MTKVSEILCLGLSLEQITDLKILSDFRITLMYNVWINFVLKN